VDWDKKFGVLGRDEEESAGEEERGGGGAGENEERGGGGAMDILRVLFEWSGVRGRCEREP